MNSASVLVIGTVLGERKLKSITGPDGATLSNIYTSRVFVQKHPLTKTFISMELYSAQWQNPHY